MSQNQVLNPVVAETGIPAMVTIRSMKPPIFHIIFNTLKQIRSNNAIFRYKNYR